MLIAAPHTKTVVSFIYELFHSSSQDEVLAVTSKEDLYKALYNFDFTLMILCNRTVMNLQMNIRGVEMCKYIDITEQELINAMKEIDAKGICRIIRRKKIFNKTEYRITGVWSIFNDVF